MLNPSVCNLQHRICWCNVLFKLSHFEGDIPISGCVAAGAKPGKPAPATCWKKHLNKLDLGWKWGKFQAHHQHVMYSFKKPYWLTKGQPDDTKNCCLVWVVYNYTWCRPPISTLPPCVFGTWQPWQLWKIAAMPFCQLQPATSFFFHLSSEKKGSLVVYGK